MEQAITIDGFPLVYTLCFLTRASQVLMLYRFRPPNQHKWNGVGGRIEPGESPQAACLREVREETGFMLTDARFGGVLTWTGFEVPNGGLYIFTAEAPPGDPRANDEGRLAWKPVEWACTSPEVVDNLHCTLPHLLNGAPAQRYHFEYHAGQMAAWQILPLL